jgi:hypothetical protein
MDETWGQYVPAWIEALATFGALIAATLAAYFAWRGLRAEADRTERAEAQGLSAWWVTGPLDGEVVWAVVVSNSSTGVYRNVVVNALGNSHPRGPEGFTIRMLPPGQWLIRSLSRTGVSAWGPKRRLNPAEFELLDPLLDARRWDVTSIRFHDGAMREWVWTTTDGLNRPRAARRG